MTEHEFDSILKTRWIPCYGTEGSSSVIKVYVSSREDDKTISALNIVEFDNDTYMIRIGKNFIGVAPHLRGPLVADLKFTITKKEFEEIFKNGMGQ